MGKICQVSFQNINKMVLEHEQIEIMWNVGDKTIKLIANIVNDTPRILLKNQNDYEYLTQEEVNVLFEDLKDLGKVRQFKKLKQELEL
jgi:hypothetical protein